MVYKSDNNQYKFLLEKEYISRIAKYVKKAGREETGGILIGAYNADHSTAILKKITGPPPDSRYGSTWFERGLQGLQKLLNSLWGAGEYYLGEWHFHPLASPSPSFQDISQMKSIANSKTYRCPEPILLIIGGDHNDYKIRVFVSVRKDKFIELRSSDRTPRTIGKNPSSDSSPIL